MNISSVFMMVACWPYISASVLQWRLAADILELERVRVQHVKRVNLELHKPVGGGRGVAGAEVERRRCRWGRGVGRGLSSGKGSGKGAVPLPRKIFDFGSQYGEFWCILVVFFTIQLPVLHVNRYNLVPFPIIFGFKKSVGCNHTIYTASQVINKYISGGNTANLGAFDISRAFDKVNHHALYIKLMKRHVPAKVLDLLEKLMSYSYSCIK